MFFVFKADDKANTQELRQATRAKHHEYVHAHHDNIRLIYGGPLADHDGQMNGTFILLEAPDYQIAENFINNDPYMQAGLFEHYILHALHEKAATPNIIAG